MRCWALRQQAKNSITKTCRKRKWHIKVQLYPSLSIVLLLKELSKMYCWCSKVYLFVIAVQFRYNQVPSQWLIHVKTLEHRCQVSVFSKQARGLPGDRGMLSLEIAFGSIMSWMCLGMGMEQRSGEQTTDQAGRHFCGLRSGCTFTSAEKSLK